MKKHKTWLVKTASLMLSALLLAGISLPLGGGKVEAINIPNGGAYGELSGANDIEFDAAGNMYIVNTRKINKITPDGTVTVVESNGIYGKFDSPQAIAFDAAGNMYIAASNSTINKITPGGTVTEVASGGIYGVLSMPSSIVFDSVGNMYIANKATYSSTINKIAPDGTVTIIGNNGIWGEFTLPLKLAIDSADNLYIVASVSDPNYTYLSSLKIVANDGSIYDLKLEHGNIISCIGIDSLDNVYLGINGQTGILKVTPNDSYFVQNGGVYGNLDGTIGEIAFDSEDTMYTIIGGVRVNKVVDYSGTYTIQSKNSSLLMDVQGGGTDQGVNVIQWPSNDGINQQWIFERLESGYYKITSALSGMSLDVYGGGTDQGVNVIQWPYHGGTNQQWMLVENADGSISFMSRLAEENGTRYVLDVYGGGTDQGVNVIQWSSTGGNNQKWTLNPVEAHTLSYDSNGGTSVAGSDIMPGLLLSEPTSPTKDGSVFGGWYKDAALTQKWNFTKDKMPSADLTLYAKWEKDFSGIYNIRSKNSELVMDVYGGGTDQGVNVIQWPYHGQSNQQWKFESLGNGYYKVTSMLSGLSIDVYGGGTSLGNKVIQWPYHGGTNQQWRIIENADGTVSLMSRLAEESGTGYLLDVFGGGKDQGVNVIQWTAHFGDNQKWYLDGVKE